MCVLKSVSHVNFVCDPRRYILNNMRSALLTYSICTGRPASDLYACWKFLNYILRTTDFSSSLAYKRKRSIHLQVADIPQNCISVLSTQWKNVHTISSIYIQGGTVFFTFTKEKLNKNKQKTFIWGVAKESNQKSKATLRVLTL